MQIDRGRAGSSIKVLIVDFEARSVHQVSAALQQRGYATLEATTFADAKKLLLSESPDVLVADVRLGQFNGLQLLMRAREEKPNVAAVITCRFPDPVLEAETRRLGGTFLVKPLDPNQVLAAVDQALSRQRDDAPPDRWQESRRIAVSDRWADRRTPAQDSEGERRVADRRQVSAPILFPDRRAQIDRRRVPFMP